MVTAGQPKRAWQQIAEEASKELDSTRLMELVNELTRALDAQKHENKQSVLDSVSLAKELLQQMRQLQDEKPLNKSDGKAFDPLA